jgi:hypothetical protein
MLSAQACHIHHIQDWPSTFGRPRLMLTQTAESATFSAEPLFTLCSQAGLRL